MKKLIFMAAIAALLFTGCAKDGDTGPQGTQGNTGPQGNPGISQIKCFYEYLSASTDFTNLSTNTNTTRKKAIVYLPELTSSVLNDGLVMVYEEGATDVWKAMPYTSFFTSGHALYHSFTSEPNWINIYLESETNFTISGIWSYKIVVASNSLRQANPDLNWNDYKEVCRRFNLEQ